MCRDSLVKLELMYLSLRSLLVVFVQTFFSLEVVVVCGMLLGKQDRSKISIEYKVANSSIA